MSVKSGETLPKQSVKFLGVPVMLVQMLIHECFGFLNGTKRNARRGVGVASLDAVCAQRTFNIYAQARTGKSKKEEKTGGS